MNRNNYIYLIVTTIFFFSLAQGSDRVNLRSLGMGRNGVSVAQGIEALSVNPANLGKRGIGTVNVALLPLYVRAGTDLFPYHIYDKYFTGVDTGGEKRARYYLTDTDKDEIRSYLPDVGMTKINADILYAGFSVDAGKFGSIAFGVIDHAGIEIALSRDFFELFYLDGLKANRIYDFSQTAFNAWWYREYNLSYGRELPIKIPFVNEFYAGIGIKFLRGYGIFETTENKSSIVNRTFVSDDEINTLVGTFQFSARRSGVDFFNKTDNDSDNVKFQLFPDPAGKGVGFDLGVAAVLYNGINVGLSIINIGTINWDKNVTVTKGDGQVQIQGFVKDLGDTVENAAKGRSSAGEAFSTALPTVLNLGASIEASKVPFLQFIPGKLLLAFQYTQGFNTSLGNTTKPRFSLGMEYRIIPFVPIRSGLIVGGGDDPRWSFGTGLDFRYFAVELASDNFVGYLTNSNAVTIALGLKIRI